MKRKLRGLKRRDIQLDFDLYRVDVPISGLVNANLSVIDLNPEAAKQTIMFVHGYAGCAETWEYQINHFAKEYRVVAPDLRGHGQSDAPYSTYSMKELVQDLHTIVESLDFPEKFILVGHSFGGSICVEYANAHANRLDKLILIATAGEYPLPSQVNWLLKVPLAFYRILWDYRPRWNAELHVMKRMMVNNIRNWKGWGSLRNIVTDTLVITGERDNYFPRYVFEEVVEMIPGAEVIDVGAAKHKVQLERFEAVNRAISRFINPDNKSQTSWRSIPEQSEAFNSRPWLTSYSPEIPHTIPIPRQPLDKFLESAARWVPKATATIFYGKKLKYRELDAKVNQFAHTLLGLGIQIGDRVMLVMPNSPNFIIAYYAILRAGGVVVLPNPDATSEHITRYARQTDAKILITIRPNTDLAQHLQENTSINTTIFAGIHDIIVGSKYGHDLATSIETVDKELSYDMGYTMSRLMMDASSEPPDIQVKHDNLAVIIYTSGTSDMPKGVALSHANLVSNALQVRHWNPDLKYGKERFLSVIPLSHSYGMTAAMNVAITIGASIILLPGFELHQVLDHIRRYRPSIFPGVPAMYTAISQAPKVRNYGLSSIKACISGAAPLPVEVQESFEKLTQGRLVEGYGLTECSPMTHVNPLQGNRKIGSIGIPAPNTDAKIVDLTTGEDVTPGHIGELLIRGPQVMKGYWTDDGLDPEPDSIIKDGWLYTGDVAVMDTDGFFKIVSRKRDTILTGKYSVYPRDIEEVLYENNKVLEAAVVGVGTSTEDQKIKAFVVPRHNTTLSKEELIELCKKRLEPYEVPWEIEFREELPKSFVGKVLRRMLEEEQ